MLSCKELKRQAERSLNQTSSDPKRLLLIHVSVITVASLLLNVLSYFLEIKIGTTGGLSHIKLRSILSTAQAVMQLFFAVLMPLWLVGYRSVTLSIARGEKADTGNLLAGIRAFFPLLRLYLLLVLLFTAIFLIASYLFSYLYVLTPWGKSLSAQLSLAESASMETLETILANHALSITIFGCGLCFALAIPVFYRIRLCLFRILDGQFIARRAISESVRLTKGNWSTFLKLDLHFCWFYLAQFVITMVGYADVLLGLAGYTLPFSPGVQYFVPYLCSLLLQFVFLLWQKNRVAVTYALAYDTLRKAKEAAEAPQAET